MVDTFMFLLKHEIMCVDNIPHPKINEINYVAMSFVINGCLQLRDSHKN